MNTRLRIGKYAMACIFSLVLICIMAVTGFRKENVESNEDIILPLKFSVSGGFFSEDFELRIETSKNATIYYTTDGSVPNKDSLIYNEPILITNATENDNYYSMITDVSAGLRTELLEYYHISGPGYVPPDFLVDKCTIIRAVAMDENENRSEEVIETYFVGISPNQYDGCNILSLITDPDNLFGYEKGIYVTGKRLEDYLYKNDVSNNWMYWDANYHQRGKEWERDAHISIFYPNGDKFLDQTVGIRVRGGISRNTLPKSLNLYARNVDGKNENFGYTFWGNNYDPTAMSLTAGGNQLITQFNDYMMTDRVSELNIATTKFEPYVLFINGEYWGFYWLSEKYDEHFFEHYYDVKPNDVVMIKNGEVELGTDQDYRLYHEMRNYITLMDMSNDIYYAKACEMIDMESFMDYFATMLYIGRCGDWPLNNYALWRTRSNDGDDFSDGRWRWILFDCNSESMTENLIEDDNLLMLLRSEPLFISLWENQNFQESFKQRLRYITETCFDAEEMDRYISQYIVDMKPILEKSWKRFYGSENNKEEEFMKVLESNRQFFIHRPQVIEDILASY